MRDSPWAIIDILGAPICVADFLLWGGLATVLLTLFLSLSRWLGISRMGLPFLLGTAFTSVRRKAVVIGILVHTLNEWLISVVYAVAFQRLQMASWWLGMSSGLVHALVFLLILMPLLPAIHPRMASERHGPSAHRLLEPPGFFGLNYGKRTPITAVAAHLIYGAVLGGDFEIVVQRPL